MIRGYSQKNFLVDSLVHLIPLQNLRTDEARTSKQTQKL